MPTHAKNRRAARDNRKAKAEASALAEAQAAAEAAANKPRVGYSNTANRAGNMNIRDADYIPFNQYMQLKRMAEKYPNNSAYPGIIANMEKSGKVEFDANSADDNRAITDTVNRLFPERQYGLNYAQGKYIADGNGQTPVNKPPVYDSIGGNVRIDDGKGGIELWQNNSPRISYEGIDGSKQSISNDAIQANTQVVAPSFSGGQQTYTEDRSNVAPKQSFNSFYRANSIDDDMAVEKLPADVNPWGENPGFRWKVGGNRIVDGGLTKQPGGGFWSADTGSDFWKTDAGAAKATEIWGEPLNSYVPPKPQEFDIQSIRNWWSENIGK